MQPTVMPAENLRNVIAAGVSLLLASACLLACHHGSSYRPPRTLADCAGVSIVSDLPIIEVPAEKPGDTLAIMVSGDGGWRAIDQRVSQALASQGVAVAGLNAPSFLSDRKTPEETACAIERMVLHYSTLWHRKRLLMVGYSRGAGMLPFAISRFPSDMRGKITTVALLGLDETIDFKFSPKVLFRSVPDEMQIPVTPELRKLRGLRILCFRGETEDDSLCKALPAGLVTEIVEPGGHHFAGKYEDLAAQILRGHA